jgi:hypothetical protein
MSCEDNIEGQKGQLKLHETLSVKRQLLLGPIDIGQKLDVL